MCLRRCQILRGPWRPPKDGSKPAPPRAFRTRAPRRLDGRFLPWIPAMSFAATTALHSEPFTPVSVPVDDHVHAVRGEFAAVVSMRHAGPCPVRLRYEWVGPASAPVVVLAGGISAHRHVASN